MYLPGALLSVWKSIHIINHIKPAERNTYAASDPGSALPVSLRVCALIQNQTNATGSDETTPWKCIQCVTVVLLKSFCHFWRKKIINKNHFIMIICIDLQYKQRSVNTSVWYFTHNIAACQAYHHCCENTKTCRYFIPKSFIFISVTLNMACNPTKVRFSD